MRSSNPFDRKGLAVVNLILKPMPKPSLLLIKKRAFPNDPWSFDVGFPGGMVKEGEDPLSALMRETEEETGISPSVLEVLALVGLDRPIIMPQVIIRAYLSLLVGEHGDFKLDLSEVSEAFWAPLSEIRGPAKMYHPFKKRVVEAYVYSHHIIWGVSKRILESAFPLLNSLRIRGVSK
ncbi:MAG: NUDIX domain-containing protein [Desulfurococcales archaeon]|jgi:8-oxo-dGTP pyrophosphatase MutT (NUDIX family)|nr:NUDIX domain-containing protein [Desulfurococcales archaeon]